ncbi:amidohydrolase family protein [Streptomyces sp. NPDC050564]|uniref:amidohydrolase family protein n=1 Tax=Streptomyces sp. NPDC050564 TaxID=3365631 RepID=UPI0037936B5D
MPAPLLQAADAPLDPQALRTVPVMPARLFGVDRDLGAVEEGRPADLTVVDGDPLMRRDGCCDGPGLQVSRRGEALRPRGRRHGVIRSSVPDS